MTSAKYLLPCSCGKQLPVETSQAGERITCDCGKEIEVPTLLKLRQLDHVPSEDVAVVRRRSWGGRQRMLLLGSVLALAGLAWTAWCFHTRPRFDLTITTAPAAFTLDFWDSLKGGIDAPTYSERVISFDRVWRTRWIVVGLAVAGLGLAMVIASFVIKWPTRPLTNASDRSPG